MNIALETLSRPRARCCGTCRAWTLEHGTARVVCPALQRYLPNDLTRHACDLWQREVYETDARELWAALGGVEVGRG